MLTYPSISPVALQIGPLAIRWYALAYLGGVLSGWWLAGRLNRRFEPPLFSEKAYDDVIVWVILGIILGGRLGYVLFYLPDYYFAHPLEILMVWHGGMSFHGGLLGTIVAAFLFARKYKIRFLSTTDLMAVVAPIGICLGRLANFVNGELYGRITGSPLGMIFPSDPSHMPRHPSELYEASLEGVALFVFLLVIASTTRAFKYPGLVSGLFLIGYAIARSTCELFRKPDSFIHFLPSFITMGQILCIPMMFLGHILSMLLNEITEYIGRYGSISVAEYMKACNTHYYATRDPFGASGDFTTAPEISQVFGELIGAWIHEQWQQVSGEQAILCEAGPGRGTLMKDLLRVTRNSGLLESTDVALIETSPTLRELQARNLKHSHSRIKWYGSLDSVPQMPFFFIANEFFDALPIHQYVGDQERAVAVVKGKLAFIPEGRVTRETSPLSVELVRQIAMRIKTHGGAAIIIDYGYETAKGGDTLQAMKDHKYVAPLEVPGESDLTAYVDFLSLKKAAFDAGVHAEVMEQGKFLSMAGVNLRAEQLCQNASEEQKEKILLGIERLVSPGQMGILFKVLTITGEAARE